MEKKKDDRHEEREKPVVLRSLADLRRLKGLKDIEEISSEPD